MTAPELLPCPFCGDQPWFDKPQSYDNQRYYISMHLECCSKLQATIGYDRYRNMTGKAITSTLKQELTAVWNTRAVAPSPAYVAGLDDEPFVWTWQSCENSQGWNTKYGSSPPEPGPYISDIQPLFAARPAGADTRVVTVAQLERAMKTTMSGIVRDEIRARGEKP